MDKRRASPLIIAIILIAVALLLAMLRGTLPVDAAQERGHFAEATDEPGPRPWWWNIH